MMLDGETEDPQSTITTGMMYSKTACDRCGQRRTVDIALKQCGGCKVAWYCSKQCQVAAWPIHK